MAENETLGLCYVGGTRQRKLPTEVCVHEVGRIEGNLM